MSAQIAPTSTNENYYVSSTTEKAKVEELEKSQKKEKVSHDDFLKLLMTQLTHQDPLNPMDDTQFLGQMAQLQALDEQVALTETMSGMRQDSALQGASSMIGKQVSGRGLGGGLITGNVVRATFSDNKTYVVLENNNRIEFTEVTEVVDPNSIQQNMSESVDRLQQESELISATNMIGMTVDGVDADGIAATGIVEKIVVRDNTTYLVLDGSNEIPLVGVTQARWDGIEF